jgi:NADPH-dependent ferric siderophore reductase
MEPTSGPGVAAPGQRRRPLPYPGVVTAVEALSPHLLRIALNGDGLAGFRWPGPASHLKVFLPEPGQRDVVLPPADEDGFMLIEPGRPRPTTRTFTPRRWDPAAGRLELEFVLHGRGPASEWASRARPGDRVAVSQPRRTYEVLPDSRWLLLAGDETAVPAIATLLEAISPSLSVHVLIEREAAHEKIPLPAHPRVVPHWLSLPVGDPPGTALTAAVAAWTPPAGAGQAWTACEATAVRSMRRLLLGPMAMPAERISTRGYWRLGAANHPDHDNGDEPL